MRDEQAIEELRFIYRVMQEAGRSIRSLHQILIFFGGFLMVGSAGTYLLNWLYPPLGTSKFYWFWLGYWLGPAVLFIVYGLWRQRWHRPASWGERLLWVLWGSCLGGAVLLGSVLPYVVVSVRAGWGLPPTQWALIGWDEFLKWAPIAIVLGVALLLTGFIYRVRGLSVASLGCWGTALLMALVPPQWVNGAAGFGLGLSFLYGGWRLKRERERQELSEAFQRFKELVYEPQHDDA